MRTSANRAPNGVTVLNGRSSLKVVSELGFKTTENELQQEILEALGERTRLIRASITAVLLGFLALLFIGNAVAVSLGITTPSLAGRITLAGALLLVGAEIALIAHELRKPAEPAPSAEQTPALASHQTRRPA